ncbi:hypothetical protein DES53_108191 [Roseimicrobium gellanilyticum]|uniref:BNR repeat protein n=1 Tax=Roseimicrobium gellanilyticum TaxID=748857 RepID=A0A366HFM2_9BACT|nr:sialidase family protein [Roseimicrobium gellanilyticum]RBP40484.1 hypothetical protein DES53_108191 [Roseimicrobium gellanilyticum]
MLRTLSLSTLLLAAIHTAYAGEPAAYRIEHQVLLSGKQGLHFTQSRTAIIPGNPPQVILTTQETELHGAHGYRDMLHVFSADLGRTWKPPVHIENLRRTTLADGYDIVIGDVCPQWHGKMGVVLATGKTFNFRDSKTEDRARERVSYTVYDPKTQAWSGLNIVQLPEKDHEGKPMLEANAGCHQRFDLENGDILLPIRYRKDPKTRQYTTIVARCAFDGKTLTYKEHGSELTTVESGSRGLYEPSVTGFGGRYFVTMRSDKSAFVARSKDGINYEPIVEWKYDDGQVLGSYNTQQHWVTHSDALYLVYTRRGAHNDHVFRHRAPLFIAQVDPEKMCVLRNTEQVLMPETGVDLGNFGVMDLNPQETWVVTSEASFPKERLDEPNRILLARIHWARPNQTAAAQLGAAK